MATSNMNATPRPQEIEATTNTPSVSEGFATKDQTQAGYPPANPEPDVSPQQDALPRGGSEKKADWTVMVYIAADALLANFGVESLKQLNQGASSLSATGSTQTVVVAAQFSIDAPAGQRIPRYIFNECSGGNLGRSLAGYFDASPNTSEQEALAYFLNWVYTTDACKADNYALILWSHGPELFLQPPPGSPTGATGSLYLTPLELRHAITNGTPAEKNGKLKIIGFDACSMSMFEMAYEMRNLAQYMVASQEEVPDLSFPYSSLVQLIRIYGANPDEMLRRGVQSYVLTYQDYISNSVTSMQPVTLTALRLDKTKSLFDAINCLAWSLMESQCDPDLPQFLINAREKSRDYAGGLYVDLVEFCTSLFEQLFPSTVQAENDASAAVKASPTGVRKAPPCDKPLLADAICHKINIRNACLAVLRALKVDEYGVSDGFVLVNCSGDAKSHGVSLYLPYLNDDVVAQLEQPMVKGTRDVPIKGFSLALNASASGYLMGRRQSLILDTEAYYGDLGLAADTEWYEFITKFWTRILINLSSRDLDLRYSGIQSAINSVRPARKQPAPPPAGCV